MTPLPPALAALHRELGIPDDYAARLRIPAHIESDERTLIEIAVNPEGRPVRVTPATAAAWRRMQPAAAADGITLLAVSGFRSLARQTEMIRERLAGGRSMESILRFVAAPGFSEHHTGRALDIASPEHIELDEDFERTAAFRWLAAHAGDFGFAMSYPRDNPTGIGYEPWHWCLRE